MSTDEWPDNPNRINAVGGTLPVLSSVLMGFLGAYFASAALSDHTYLAEPMVLEIFRYQICETSLSRKLAISVTTAFGVLLIFASMLSSVATKMLDWKSSDQDFSGAPSEITDGWDKDRLQHAKIALVCFHLTLPIMALSLMLLTKGTVLFLGVMCFSGWLIYQVVKLPRELRR